LEAYITVIFLYTYFIDILKQQWPGSQLSGAKKQNQYISTGSVLSFFTIEKPFFDSKILRTVKKSKMYQLVAREREEISQIFQRIWIQQIKGFFLCKKFSKILMHC
jgi:hypothetical protein